MQVGWWVGAVVVGGVEGGWDGLLRNIGPWQLDTIFVSSRFSLIIYVSVQISYYCM